MCCVQGPAAIVVTPKEMGKELFMSNEVSGSNINELESILNN